MLTFLKIFHIMFVKIDISSPLLYIPYNIQRILYESLSINLSHLLNLLFIQDLYFIFLVKRMTGRTKCLYFYQYLMIL